jgi:MFS family permease
MSTTLDESRLGASLAMVEELKGNNNDPGETPFELLMTTTMTEDALAPGPPSANTSTPTQSSYSAHRRRIATNFVWMSLLFSINHGCVVACLSVATARLGAWGAGQSGVLYISYTSSALLGATYIVKTLGSRNALLAGMALYTSYVGCFYYAALYPDNAKSVHWITLVGAGVGGVGAGFLWTAQGSYFAQSVEQYAESSTAQSMEESSAWLSSIFAFVYLTLELILRSLSTFIFHYTQRSWTFVFQVYFVLMILSALGMLSVHSFPRETTTNSHSSHHATGYSNKLTAAWDLLVQDSKMKYMIGLNASFGFASAFVNAYVNSEVVRVVFQDDESRTVGILSAGSSTVAAISSLVLGGVSRRTGKGPVLYLGAACFLWVALPFVLQPHLEHWTRTMVVIIYTLQGVGRATFEGTLKATFADYFSYEKEGAFANIILHNGLSSAVGFFVPLSLPCRHATSPYCVPFHKDGALHDVLCLELLVVGSSLLAGVGYWRASVLHRASARQGYEPLLERVT